MISNEIERTTKSGFKYYVSFSNDTPDFDRLARFFLLLASSPNSDNNKTDKEIK